MYGDYFGLRIPPFDDRADTQFFFPTPDREEALAAMEYEASHGCGMALVLGDVGTGKTLLIRTLLLRFHSSVQVTVVNCQPSGGIDLIRETCKGFGVTLASSAVASRNLNRLRRQLTRKKDDEQRSILIIDQAENLSTANLAQLATLADVQHENSRLLSIVVVGHLRFKTLLTAPELVRLQQQLFHVRIVDSFTVSQTCAYIEHRLRVAGAGGKLLFDESAVALIGEAAKGNPRLINHLCDAALLSAYGARSERVTTAIAAEVCGQRVLDHKTIQASNVTVGPSRIYSPQVGQDSTALYVDPWTGPVKESASNQAVNVDDDSCGGGFDHGPDSHPTHEPSWSDYGIQSEVGTVTLSRLERALARAERMHVTWESSLMERKTIEGRLTNAVGTATVLAEKLSSLLQQGEGAVETFERRMERTVQKAHAQTQAALDFETRSRQSAGQLSGLANRIDGACKQAEEKENRLTGFAADLVDRAGEVQERVAQLMAGLKTQADSQTSIEETLQRASNVKLATDAALQTLESRVQDSLAENEKWLKQCADSVRKEYEQKLNEQRAALEREEEEFSNTLEDVLHQRTDESTTTLNSLTQRLNEQWVAVERRQEEWSRSVEENLQRRTAESTATFSALGECASQAAQRLESVMAEANRLEKQIVEPAIEAAKTMLREEAATFETNIKQQVASATTDLGALVARSVQVTSGAESVVNGLRKELDAALVEAEGISRTVAQSAIETCRREFAEGLAQAERAQAQWLGRTTSAVEAIEERVEKIESRAQVLQRTADRSEQTIHRLTSDADHLETHVQNTCGTVAELDRRAAKIQEPLDSLVERAQTMILEVQQSSGQVAQMQRAVAGQLVDMGRASEIASTLAGQVGRAEPLLEGMANAQKKAEEISTMISQVTDEASPMTDALRLAVEAAETQVSRLDSHHAAATGTLQRLMDTTVTSQQRISDTTRKSDSSLEVAASTMKQLERLTQDVLSLTSTSESRIKELEESKQRAYELAERIEGAVGSAKNASLELATQLSQANEQAKTFDERSTQAAELAARLEAIHLNLETAKELDASVMLHVESAKKVHDELDVSVRNATLLRSDLSDVDAIAQGLHENFEQMRLETETALSKLSEQLTHPQAVIDKGDRVQKQITIFLDQMTARISSLETQVSTTEENIQRALEQPAGIISEAQQQTTQLERVFQAVQKVFAKLSQAGLEANHRINEFRQLRDEAQDRVSQLAVQTEQATNVLHEWVGEASRVQGRLERTLKEAPTLGQTHTPEPLANISRILRSPLRIGLPTKKSEMKEMTPPASTPSPGAAVDLAQPLAREEEVSEIIEEAKQFARQH